MSQTIRHIIQTMVAMSASCDVALLSCCFMDQYFVCLWIQRRYRRVVEAVLGCFRRSITISLVLSYAQGYSRCNASGK
ncbi:hypothetical protein RRG08_042179 [Elysia crispata]|uniref:Uncharacterized protein n=1 Tax=Elysia crispata TaxID=231223 RepID=A0AAE0Z5X5_9GAST|nr:hypothetical protein RRG08_042179 [Elysia crispata]